MSRIPPVPSGITGVMRTYLEQIARQLNGEAYISKFSGTNPNSSAITGIPGDLAVNVRSASDGSRLWGKSGSTVASSTTGWVQFGGGGTSSTISTKVKSGDQGFASVAASDVSDLGFAITAGGKYHYRFVVPHQLSLATQGIGLAVNGPASNTLHNYRVSIPNAVDGVGSAWEGWSSANADLVTSDAGPAANTGFLALVEGVIVPTNDGTLQLQAANEVATSLVTIRAGACGFLTTL